MQTHEWEALLKGATEGPWKVYNEDSIMILDADDTSVLDLDERYLTHKLSDVRLAAHAPAAVAEVVRQAAQIERLQAALRQADKDAFWASADRYVGPGPLTYEEPDWTTYNLHPGEGP